MCLDVITVSLSSWALLLVALASLLRARTRLRNTCTITARHALIDTSVGCATHGNVHRLGQVDILLPLYDLPESGSRVFSFHVSRRKFCLLNQLFEPYISVKAHHTNNRSVAASSLHWQRNVRDSGWTDGGDFATSLWWLEGLIQTPNRLHFGGGSAETSRCASSTSHSWPLLPLSLASSACSMLDCTDISIDVREDLLWCYWSSE